MYDSRFPKSVALTLIIYLLLSLNFARTSSGLELAARQLTDINPDGDGFPARTIIIGALVDSPEFTPIGEELFLTADTGQSRQLFRISGSSIAEVGHEHMAVSDLHNLAGELVFTSETPKGRQLVKLQGQDAEVLGSYSELRWLNVLDGEIVFFARSSPTFPSPWHLYTTHGNDVSLPIGEFSNTQAIPWKVGEYLYLPASGNAGRELFTFDGNTLTEFDLNPGPESSEPQRAVYRTGASFTTFELNGRSFFTAEGPNGRELYRSDGTSVVEFDLWPGASSSSPRAHQLFDGHLYFTASTGVGRRRMYQVNETDQPSIVGDLFSQHPFTTFQDELYFTALGSNQHGPVGPEMLYRFDGTTTVQIPADESSLGLGMDHFIEYGGYLYFAAHGANGEELYRTDGNRIEMFADIYPGDFGSSPSGFFESDGELFFAATGTNGRELFKTDGGTLTEFDIYPGPESGVDEFGASSFGGSYSVEYANTLFLTATGPNGTGLFVVDGEEVFEIPINPDGGAFDPVCDDFCALANPFFTEFNGQLFFLAVGPAGRELYEVVVVPEPYCFSMITVAAIVLWSVSLRSARCFHS